MINMDNMSNERQEKFHKIREYFIPKGRGRWLDGLRVWVKVVEEKESTSQQSMGCDCFSRLQGWVVVILTTL